MSQEQFSTRWLRTLPLIPLALASLIVVGLIYALFGQVETRVINPQDVFLVEGGEPVELGPVTLDPDLRYTLKLSQLVDRKRVNSWVSVEAALLNVETGEEIFEIADDYWAEEGIWHEDGESGTWEEQNADTTFHFRVAEPGEHVLRLQNAENSQRAQIEVRAQIVSRKPTILHWVPLLIGLVTMLILAVVTYARRRQTLIGYMEKMGAGSTLSIAGVHYTVMDRRVHNEPGEPKGYEWRLRSEQGEERYLAIETYEYMPAYAEDEVNGRYLLIDRPDARIQHLGESVRVDGKAYIHDAENSGRAVMLTYFEDEVFRSPYTARIYHPGDCPSPTAWGEWIVEHLIYDENDEEEWCAMELLNWHKIDALQVIPAPSAQF